LENHKHQISHLEDALGYTFNNPQTLLQALTHRSYANEHPKRAHNETLEFLGDAVLDLIIGHELMQRFPTLSEGELSMTRAHMVSCEGLNLVARKLPLGDALLLGKGEETSGGRTKDSLLANALEAVIAALFLDAGFERTRNLVLKQFTPHIPQRPGQHNDYKTQLQERVQALHKEMPIYHLVEHTGPAHDRRFEMAVHWHHTEQARGIGISKKAAEQVAAQNALHELGLAGS